MTPTDNAPRAAFDSLSPLTRRYREVRAHSEALAAPLTAEDQAAQSMPDASPTKWHLAHTSWFFETFLLSPHLADYAVFDPTFGYLFNSYYEAVGPRQTRAERGLITRPGVADVIAYRAHVDAGMARLLADLPPALTPLIELGLAHEEQHQELILMDILHLFSRSVLSPAYRPPSFSNGQPAAFADAPALGWRAFDGGVVEIGAGGRAFAFDNETPRHKVYLQPFALADRLTTNGEWLAFMADGGYRRSELWLSDGWAIVQAEGWEAPLYWRNAKSEGDDSWSAMTLEGLVPVDPNAPVAHVSYYEAAAFAEWAGARLPSEAEWEHAAVSAGAGLAQLYDQAWQWTRSSYDAYPGFHPGPGAVGEYNGKFMVGQMSLRGGASVTPPGHTRPTYRNFFHPRQRWAFSGLRLARDGASARQTPSVAGGFAEDVIEGLSKPQKNLPPKYFYDDEGSRLFEAICETPEYYPTRTELALLREAAPEIAAHISEGAVLVEFGSGASLKTRLLLDAAPQAAAYVPIDISPDALEWAAAALRADYPNLTISPLAGDFSAALSLPPIARGRPRTGFFPGSTIGNFAPSDAVEFLVRARSLLGAGAQFLVGADLVKDEATLVAAYDDAAGVTAAFNRNLLVRINRELGGDFDPAAFDHKAIWNAADSRMEMWLISRRDQVVHAAGGTFRFREGEGLHTENSYKFTPQGFAALAERGGWSVMRQWVSEAPAFGVFLLSAS